MSVLVAGVEDYLDDYRQDLDYQLILKKRREAYVKQSMHSHVFSDYLSQITTFKSREVTLNSAVVQIGRRDELTVSQYLDLQYGLRLFFPWKKGPFSFFETMIDSEWRSDLKWQRIRPWCGSLANKVVADVGAHNGYFMFRMAQEQAKLVLGFDPSWKFYCNFSFLQTFAQIESLFYEPLGVEEMQSYESFFDCIFCLGILYHHSDPIGMLRKLYRCLRKKGTIIIDCQGIAGNGAYYLLPDKVYTRAKGYWFLPTLDGLLLWLKKSGFKKSVCFYKEPLSVAEQRSTTWAPISSLKESLNPHDPSRTVEGYPAPWRFYVKASK